MWRQAALCFVALHLVEVQSFANVSPVSTKLISSANFLSTSNIRSLRPRKQFRNLFLNSVKLQLRVEEECQPSATTPELKLASEDDTGPSPTQSQQEEGNLLWARLVVLGVAAMYGTNFGSVKLLQDSMSPAMAAFLRFGLAGLALAPMLKNLRKEAVAPSVEIGLLVAAGYFAQGLGLQSADASTAAFLCSLAVVVCPLLDVFEGKQLGRSAWLSAGLAVGGAGVLELGGAQAPCSGDLWALLQPLAFGTAFWKTEQAMRRFPDQAMPLTAVQILVVAAAAASWALVDGGGAVDLGQVAQVLGDWKVVGALAWTGLFTTALTVVLETWALGRLSSAETTVLFSTEPLWGTGFAHALLGEHVGLNAYAGGSLILAACACSFAASTQEPAEAAGRGREALRGAEEALRVAFAGSASWVAMKLQPVQQFVADLADLGDAV